MAKYSKSNPTSEHTQHTNGSAKALYEDLIPPFSEYEAVAEASRCLLCSKKENDGYDVAPCVKGCPTKIDIPGFIAAINEGDKKKAADLVFAENILGATCGRVCPVDVLCEGACVLHDQGEKPIEIGRLQRFATEDLLEEGMQFRNAGKPNGKKVSVIGAGPAGLSCAAELSEMGYEVTVYDKNKEPGGLVRHGIAPYRLHREPLSHEVRRIADMGVKFRLGEAIDSEEKLRAIENNSDAVFLGVGMKGVKMDNEGDPSFPGDQLEGVWDSMDFIHQIKTEGPVKIGDNVAIIGGGNTALDVGVQARRLGAKIVNILYRRDEASMPAYRHEIDLAREEGVNIQFLIKPLEFYGDENGRVNSMKIQYMKFDGYDNTGRPLPVPVEGTEMIIPVDTVIIAVGPRKREMFLDMIGDFFSGELSFRHGLIEVNKKSGQTTNPYYFAGGDAISGGSTVVEAVQDGKIAAKGIDEFIREKEEV